MRAWRLRGRVAPACSAVQAASPHRDRLAGPAPELPDALPLCGTEKPPCRAEVCLMLSFTARRDARCRRKNLTVCRNFLPDLVKTAKSGEGSMFFRNSLEKNRSFYAMIETSKECVPQENSVRGGARLQDDRIKISAVRCVSWKIVSCCRLNATATMSASF